MDGITTRAGRRLKATLEEKALPPNRCIRYLVTNAVRDEGMMKVDERRPADAVFEHEGRVVLVVDDASAEKLAGFKLDYFGGRFCLVSQPQHCMV
ncbi:MAG: hypothetical protein PVI86_05695 [Phycisphaerae bacterium]